MIEAFPIVNTLPVWNYVLYLGYDDSAVYDLPVLGGKGVFPVNAVRFEVDCRSIPSLRQSGIPVITNTSRFGNVVTYPFHVDDSLEDVNVIPGEIYSPFCAAIYSSARAFQLRARYKYSQLDL